MSGADVTISCPHCKRQYTMKIDPERLMRLKTRATCGRCGNTFDAASRIVPASETTTDPKLPRSDAAPSPATLVPKASPLPTVPDLRDEMEELAREFAEAAARFTPIAAKRPAAVLTTPPTGTAAPEPTSPTSDAPAERAADAPSPSPPSPSPPSPSPPSVVAAVEEPTQPGVKHVAVAESGAPDSVIAGAPAPVVPAPVAATSTAAAPPADVAPSASDVAAAYDELSLEAPPAAADEFAASPPTQSRAPAPLGWLELADRGLGALEPPPSPGAAALEALLSESETLALPPTPAAS